MNSLSINDRNKNILLHKGRVELKVIPGGKLLKQKRNKFLFKIFLYIFLYLLFNSIIGGIFYFYIQLIK